MSLGEAAAEGDCWCDSFEVADVESWPSGIWVTDSNTEKRRKGEPLRISSVARAEQNLMTSRTRALSLAVSSPHHIRCVSNDLEANYADDFRRIRQQRR